MYWGCEHHHHGHHHHAGPRGPRGPFGRGRPGFGGGPPGWWGDWFGGPPLRADRGGVRYLVLDVLAERARHGYEIIQAIEQRSGDAYRPSPGVIYPTLQMLEELGHARAVDADGRKVYEITDAGRAELEANREYVDEFYERFAESSWERFAEDFGDVMKRIGTLMKTLRRAMHRGRLTPALLARTVKVLDKAAAEIEALLDEDSKDRPGGRR